MVYTLSDFNPNHTIREFLKRAKEFISMITGLEETIIEIVETNKQNGEDDLELIESNNIFKQVFPNYNFISFYFRPKLTISTINEPCCICLTDNNRCLLITECNHHLCSMCYNISFERNLTSCPYCRSPNTII